MKLVSEMKREFICLVGEAYGLSGLNPKHRKASLVLEVETTMRLTQCQICGGPCKPEVHAFDISQPPFSTSLLSPLTFNESDEEVDEDASARPGNIDITSAIAAAAQTQTPGLQTQEVLGAGFVASSSAPILTPISTPALIPPPSTAPSSMASNPSSIVNHGLLRQSPSLPGGVRGSLDSGPRMSYSHLSSQTAGSSSQQQLGSHPHHQAHSGGQQGQFSGQLSNQIPGYLHQGQFPTLGFNQPNLVLGQSSMIPNQAYGQPPKLSTWIPGQLNGYNGQSQLPGQFNQNFAIGGQYPGQYATPNAGHLLGQFGGAWSGVPNHHQSIPTGANSQFDQLQQQVSSLANQLQNMSALRSMEPFPPTPPLIPGLDPPPHLPSPNTYSSLPNLPNMKVAGISIGPLRSLDTAGSANLSGGKKKLLSGEHSSAHVDVVTQIAWPHNCLDAVLCPNPPAYADMTIAEFAAGFAGKILAEMPAQFRGSATENQLRHLNRVCHYAMDTSFESVLAFNGAFLRGIEQKVNSWNSWEKIQEWHNRHLDSMKYSDGRRGDKAGNKAKDIKDSKQVQKLVEGVPEGFIKASKLCIMFQRELCDEPESHV